MPQRNLDTKATYQKRNVSQLQNIVQHTKKDCTQENSHKITYFGIMELIKY
jgi:hypothetical protein